MKRLMRVWCKTCGEMTNWEADEHGPLRCLDAEHFACDQAMQQVRRLARVKKNHFHKPFTIIGVVNSLRSDD